MNWRRRSSLNTAGEGRGAGLETLMKGDEHVVAGSFVNKVQAVAGRVVPDAMKAEMHRKMAEPGSGQ